MRRRFSQTSGRSESDQILFAAANTFSSQLAQTLYIEAFTDFPDFARILFLTCFQG